MKKSICFILASLIIIGLCACSSQETTPKKAEALATKEPAELPSASVAENSPMKEFQIKVHGVEDQNYYLENEVSSEDHIMVVEPEGSVLLDAYAPGVISSPGYPITIMCIPQDGVAEYVDKISVSTDFGCFYKYDGKQMQEMGQSFEMQPDYTCFFNPSVVINGAISHNEISTIRIIAYYKEQAVKETTLIITEENGNHYIRYAD